MNSVEQEASCVVVDTVHHHRTSTTTSTTTTSTSEEDQQVQHLQASGEIRQVVGSQSMLSQELFFSDKDNENDVMFSQEDSQDSKKEMTPAKAAQRYGLLTQDDDDDNCDDSSGNQDLETNMMSNTHHRRRRNGLFRLQHSEQSGFDMKTIKKEQPVAMSNHPKPHLHHLEEEKKECDGGDEEEEGPSQPPLSQETLNLSATANLGSLLDAIQHLEELEDNSFLCEQPQRKHTKKTPKNNPASKSGKRSSKRLAATNKRRRVTASPHDLPNSPVSPKPKKKRGVSPPATPLPHTSTTAISLDKTLAQAAAELAARAINDQDLSKKLLLSMALRRTSPRTAPDAVPGRGHILGDGFFWAHYPPLEKVLKQYMEDYYRLSMSKCQSAQQQSFNNDLVFVVRQAAQDQGWTFDPIFFSDKDLRDRIRCYYKTHIQNAKKRLNTMLRNPSKRSNSVHLMQHYDLIKSTLKEEQTAAAVASAPSGKQSPAKGSRRKR